MALPSLDALRHYGSRIGLMVAVGMILFMTTSLSCMILAMIHLPPNPRADFYYTRVNFVFGEEICKTMGNVFFGGTESSSYAIYGLAVPLLASVPIAYLLHGMGCMKSHGGPVANVPYLQGGCATKCSKHRGGDVNIWWWSFLLVFLPCLFMLYLMTIIGRTPDPSTLDFFEMSVLYAGDAAVLCLSLFLVPVSKHSVFLEFLGLDATHALTFHRVAGWVSLFFTLYHGLLYSMEYGLRGRESDSGFWTSVWHALIPPSACFRLHTLFTFDDDAAADTNTNHTHHGPHGSHDGRNLDLRFLDGDSDSNNSTNSNHEGGKGSGRDQVTTSLQCQGYYRNFTGLISMTAFVVLALMSIPYIRRAKYQWFYSCHILMGWTMMIGAVLHYPTVGYYMVPGILYYLAASVPVWVQQFLSSRRHSGAPLVRTRQIHNSGDCYELEFRANHDMRSSLHAFAKLCVPSISSQWHPFSVIMVPASSVTDTGSHGNDSHDVDTSITSLAYPSVRILFRATGPFTKELSQKIMQVPEQNISSSSSVPKVLLDAFYPEGTGWLEACAQKGKHDSLLMVAGGVGIVPFLSLIPDLLRHEQNTLHPRGTDGLYLQDFQTEPKKSVTVHWYCREVGLAQYVQEEYFDKWGILLPTPTASVTSGENPQEDGRNPSLQLKVVVHITSLLPQDSDTEMEDGDGRIQRISNLASSTNSVYTQIPGLSKQGSRPFVEESHWKLKRAWFVETLGSGAVVGGICLFGLFFHMWMYNHVILVHRRETCVRIITTIVVGVVAAIIAGVGEMIRSTLLNRRYGGRDVVPSEDVTEDDDSCQTDKISVTDTTNSHHQASTVNVVVKRGRPASEDVVKDIGASVSPAVFICGPPNLRTSIKKAAKTHQAQTSQSKCAFYENLSEM